MRRENSAAAAAREKRKILTARADAVKSAREVLERARAAAREAFGVYDLSSRVKIDDTFTVDQTARALAETRGLARAHEAACKVEEEADRRFRQSLLEYFMAAEGPFRS